MVFSARLAAELLPGRSLFASIALTGGPAAATGAAVPAEEVSPCTPDVCFPVIRVQDAAGQQIAAAVVDAPCRLGFSVEPARWHGNRDVLVLRCRTSAGAAAREELIALEVTSEGKVQPILRLVTGTEEFPSQEERETPGFRPIRPVGWIALRERGEAPVVEVFDPAGGAAHGATPAHDSKGKGWLAPFRYDLTARRFVEQPGGRLMEFDARKGLPQP